MSITVLSICNLSLSSDVGSGVHRFAMKSVKIDLSSVYRNSPFLLNKDGGYMESSCLNSSSRSTP